MRFLLCGSRSIFSMLMMLLVTFSHLTAETESEVASGQSLSLQSIGSSFTSWPMFRHDPIHSGFSPSVAPNTNSVAWRFSLPLDDPTGIVWFTAPTVANGKVFTATKGPPGKLLAIDEYTGVLLWNFEVPGQIRSSSPAVSRGMVFFGAWDANVYALREADGSLLWKFSAQALVSSPPVVADDTVFVGDVQGFVYAIDEATGSLRWSFQANGIVTSSPATSEGVVFVTGGSNVYALQQDSGELLWSFTVLPTRQYPYWVRSSPLVHGRIVYTGPDDGNIYALDRSTGRVLWKAVTVSPVEFTAELISSPAAAYGALFVCSWDRAAYAFDLLSGVLVWKTPSVCDINASPAVADGKVFTINGNVFQPVSSLGSGIGSLFALDASSGSVLWEAGSSSPSVYLVSPAVADGMVFTAGREIAAYGKADLRRLFELDWSDYENNGRVTIQDVANAAIVFDLANAYWDLNLNNKTDIMDIAVAAILFDRVFPDPQSYPGRGQPTGKMEPGWKQVCNLLPEPYRTYCQTRI